MDYRCLLQLFFYIHFCYRMGISEASFFDLDPRRLMKSEELCLGETFETKCGSKEVAVIYNATYGRMKLGRCVKMDMGFLGCSTDVTYLAQKRCSGKHQCQISLPDDDIEAQRPCFELKSYLIIQYFCLKVLSASDYSCAQSQFIKTQNEKGYISSEKNECSNNNIWLIEARPGQKINLTLINFGADVKSSLSSDGYIKWPAKSSIIPCNKLADIRDSITGKEEILCGGDNREEHIEKSLGNSVEIEIPNSKRQFEHEFLIKYEVIGCPDPPLGKNAWSRRNGNKITIGCKGSDVTYEMTCMGTIWTGTYENCSQTEIVTASKRQKDIFSSLPRGLVIAAILAIALVVGTIIVVVGIIVFKRKREADYIDGAYTIPKSEKVYISPNSRHPQRQQHHQRHQSATDSPVTWAEHTNKGSVTSQEGKYIDCPLGTDTCGDMHSRPPVHHDYQCVEVPGNVQVSVDQRGYAHVWERPLPAPESQHSY